MTVGVTPYRSARPVTRDGFGQLLSAEWTKFRTVRGWVLALVAGAAVMVLVGLLGTAAGSPSHGGKSALPTGPGGEGVDDSFYFVHQQLTGDGSITVPVTAMTDLLDRGPDGTSAGTVPWAKAGLIVKQSLQQGSTYAAIMVTGSHGVRMQHDYVSDTAGLTGDVSARSPRWLRLVRSGEVITGYDSVDGVRWIQVGATRLSGLPSTVAVGLFATSPQAAQQIRGGLAAGPAEAVATFGPVTVGGRWSAGQGEPEPWKGEQVGGAGNAGLSGSYSDVLKGGEFSQSATGFTLKGAGDIAPVVGGTGPAYREENFLVGAFAGLIVLIVLGTGFITTEYRFGLIRTTLAASPRRGRVLAAKAVVLGSVAFAAGLVAAVVALLVGPPRARSHGFQVIPVPTGTELRVVIGTALLLAVVTILALAVGTLLRRGAAAAAIVIAVIILPYLLALSTVLPVGPSDWLLRVTPAAGFAIQQSLRHYAQVDTAYTPVDGYYPLTPWAGFGVLCGYTALASAAAAFRLRGRDA